MSVHEHHPANDPESPQLPRNVESIDPNCRHFLGEKPCVFNKKHDVVCAECVYRSPFSELVLIIKLDFLGDVVRFGSVLPPLKQRYPNAKVYWITRRPADELVSLMEGVDVILPFDAGSVEIIKSIHWDLVLNFSNDMTSSALARAVTAGQKIGFLLSERGAIEPTNEAAAYWLTLASFDRHKRANTMSYQEIMYAIGGFAPPFARPPLATVPFPGDVIVPRLPPESTTVGINVGSGSRWPEKMLPPERTAELCRRIIKALPEIHLVLLGGKSERARLRYLHRALERSGRVHRITGEQSLKEFAGVVQRLNALVTGDTLALHLAAAYKVPTVVLFGPTQPAEIFDYYGLIRKVYDKDLPCLPCYGRCTRNGECMAAIDLDEVTAHVRRALES